MLDQLMLVSLVTMGGTGAFFGLFLAYASKKFQIEKDERMQNIEEILPGANCGACGFAGCSNYAEAIVKDGAAIGLCPVGGAKVASRIGEVMNVAANDEVVPMVAKVKCQGGKKCLDDFQYAGVQDCHTANALHGGSKSCKYACLGLGSCVKACPFDAIVINGNRVAEMDPDLCTGCEICVKTCPKVVIDMVPKSSKVHVLCKNEETGKEVKLKCQTGCIACKICERACPSSAIKVIDNVAVIDYDKCTGCMICAGKCPVKAIEGISEEIAQKEAAVTIG